MKKFISGILGVCLSIGILCGIPTNVSAASVDASVTNTLPDTMKVGQRLSGSITIQNLLPNENLWIVYPTFSSGLFLSTTFAGNTAVGGSGDSTPVMIADESGTCNLVHNYSDYIATKPGTAQIDLVLSRFANENGEYINYTGSEKGSIVNCDQTVKQITIETPIITHNAPTSVQAGETIQFNTEITNTAYQNQTINSQEKSIPFYMPSAEVIEGSGNIDRKNQDYTHTLTTSETISFNKPGTVSLKITYQPVSIADINDSYVNVEEWINMWESSGGFESLGVVHAEPYGQNTALLYLDGAIEETITINVTGNSSSDEEITDKPSDDGQAVVLTDETTGIQLDAKDGVLPDNTTLVVNSLKSGKQYDIIKDSLADVSEKFLAFDIWLENNGIKVQPNGNVTVSIPIPSDYDKSNLTVYYIDDNGTKEEIVSSVKEDNIVFATDHFSTYVLAEKSVVPVDLGSDVPKTGDSFPIAVLIVFFVAAGGLTVLLVVNKKRIRSK